MNIEDQVVNKSAYSFYIEQLQLKLDITKLETFTAHPTISTG